jgi:hypothetical protein
MSNIANLTICNCSVVVNSSSAGSGIGPGSSLQGGLSKIDMVWIANSTVRSMSSSGAAIGCGLRGGELDLLLLSGSCLIDCKSNGLTPGVNATSIVISDGSFVFVSDDAPLFGTCPSSVGRFDMVIVYHEVSSEATERLCSLPGPFLHVGNLSIPCPESCSFEFCVRTSGLERCFDDTTPRILSVIVRTDSKTDYSYPGWINGTRGDFATWDGAINFAANLDYSFLDVLYLRIAWHTCQFSATGVFGDAVSEHSTEPFPMYWTRPSDALETSGAIKASASVSYSVSTPSVLNSPPPALVHAKGSMVWIGAGSGSGVILLVIGWLFFLLGCRRLSRSAVNITESELDINISRDSEITSTAIDLFLSEENAMSLDRSHPSQLGLHEGDRHKRVLARSLDE